MLLSGICEDKTDRWKFSSGDTRNSKYISLEQQEHIFYFARSYRFIAVKFVPSHNFKGFLKLILLKAESEST